MSAGSWTNIGKRRWAHSGPVLGGYWRRSARGTTTVAHPPDIKSVALDNAITLARVMDHLKVIVVRGRSACPQQVLIKR